LDALIPRWRVPSQKDAARVVNKERCKHGETKDNQVFLLRRTTENLKRRNLGGLSICAIVDVEFVG